MSFFGRTVIVVALIAGAASVFRRDIARVVGVLRKPTENFIRDVKGEIDAASKAAGPSATAGRTLSGAGAEKAASTGAGLEPGAGSATPPPPPPHPPTPAAAAPSPAAAAQSSGAGKEEQLR